MGTREPQRKICRSIGWRLGMLVLVAAGGVVRADMAVLGICFAATTACRFRMDRCIDRTKQCRCLSVYRPSLSEKSHPLYLVGFILRAFTSRARRSAISMSVFKEAHTHPPAQLLWVS